MDGSERAQIVTAGAGEHPTLTVDGITVDVLPGHDPMLVGIQLVATTAARLGRPVPATVIADGGNWRWRILVHPDGTTSDDSVDDGGRRAGGMTRRRPSRLAVAAIGVVLAGGGVTALAVATTAGRVPGVASGAAGGVSTTAAAPSASGSPSPSRPPPVSSAAGPTANPVPSPVAGVARARRPSATSVPSVAAAPAVPVSRRTPAPVAAPKPAAPVGRIVVLSDGAGRCATSSGSAVSAIACSTSTAQKWTATAAGELRQGTRCLVTRSGVAVVDCATVPGAARTWTPTSPAPGLVNPATSLCLGVTGSTVVSAQCGTGRSLRIA